MIILGINRDRDRWLRVRKQIQISKSKCFRIPKLGIRKPKYILVLGSDLMVLDLEHLPAIANSGPARRTAGGEAGGFEF